MTTRAPWRRLSRREIYRGVKRRLRRTLKRHWRGTRAALDRAVVQLLRRRTRAELLRIARRPAAWLLVLAATVTAPVASADPISLSDVASSTDGFAVDAASPGGNSGRSVAGAGDVNGDGLDDIAIGAPSANSSGTAYVVFGKANGVNADLAQIEQDDNADGFALYGDATDERAGYSVSGAGDVNGDGLDDIVIGAWQAAPNGSISGTTYVVFGKADGTSIDLAFTAMAADGSGFAIHGAASGDVSGFSVSGGGDINGDGLDDLIIGAFGADATYVVFGTADSVPIDLGDVALDADTAGFAIHAEPGATRMGYSVSAAGDVNGDGLHDVIIGAHDVDSNGNDSGTSYVVFGKSGGESIALSDIASNGNDGGFAIHGIAAYDRAGYRVSGAGDVNGDGLADVVVGADRADPTAFGSGAAYVVFGKRDGTAVELADISLEANDGGFAIHGAAESDYAGRSVAGAGDVNGDGLADVIVGAPNAEPAGNGSGAAYIVFGKTAGAVVPLADVESGAHAGIALFGGASGDSAGSSVSGAGDVDGDGLADLIIGAPFEETDTGRSYVVFSREVPELSALYKGYSRAFAGSGTIVPETHLNDARFAVDFDDDSGDNGAGDASLETIRLYRSRTFVSNLVSAGLTPIAADVAWKLLTDRVNWTEAGITLKYVDDEVLDTIGGEDSLVLFTAPALDGPWSELEAVHDRDRNELAAVVEPGVNPRVFAIGMGMDVLWVNFGYEGPEVGSRILPFDTLQEALDAVNPGGTVKLDAFSAVTSTPGPATITQSVTLEAVDGTITIGAP